MGNLNPRGGGANTHEVPASVRVKDAMRAEPLLPRIVDALRAVIASGLERASAGPGRVALAEAAAGCGAKVRRMGRRVALLRRRVCSDD